MATQQYFGWSFLVISLLPGSYAHAEVCSTRVMPLGDSITRGQFLDEDPGVEGGYRDDLYKKLVTRGYSVDFVGGLSTGPLDFDRDHEGHDGFKAVTVRRQVENWLSANPPDVVLLHIGSNDILTTSTEIDDTVEEVSFILNRVDNLEDTLGSSVPVILAQIIVQQNTPNDVSLYNDRLAIMAQQRIAEGDQIILVDMESELTTDDLHDRRHPTDIGYGKMADTWYAALTPVLDERCGPPPEPLVYRDGFEAEQSR